MRQDPFRAAISKGGAAILAGGKSSRMGRNKPTLEIGGRTLLDRCADALRPIAAPILVVADTLDRYEPAGCRIIADLYPGAGPVGGIVTALAALGEGDHIVVACDMPFLRTGVLLLLLAAASDEYDAVAPWLETGPEPLCAVYRHTCIPLLEEFLNSGQRSARHALDTLRTRRVPESDLRQADPNLSSFINLNTPEDLRRYITNPP